MVRDSNLWEQAYKTYQRSGRPRKKPTQQTAFPVQSNYRETMVIQKELANVIAQQQELRKKERELRKLLKQRGEKQLFPDYLRKPITLYALELENGHFYIGMTRNVDKRYKQHERGKGSMWTKAYKPIVILEVRETGTDDDSEASLMEDALTIQYAQQYGPDRVHGGGYCQRKPQWPAEVYAAFS